MKKFIQNAVCDGNRVMPIARNPSIWKNHFAPPEIDVYTQAEPRVRQFPEPHRYDHREAMSKLLD